VSRLKRMTMTRREMKLRSQTSLTLMPRISAKLRLKPRPRQRKPILRSRTTRSSPIRPISSVATLMSLSRN
jgi:hypothetical protein